MVAVLGAPSMAPFRDARGPFTGRRCIIEAVDSDDMPYHRRDARIAGEPHTDGGIAYVPVVTDDAWFAWVYDPSSAKPPRCPRAVNVPAHLIWL